MGTSGTLGSGGLFGGGGLGGTSMSGGLFGQNKTLGTNTCKLVVTFQVIIVMGGKLSILFSAVGGGILGGAQNQQLGLGGGLGGLGTSTATGGGLFGNQPKLGATGGGLFGNNTRKANITKFCLCYCVLLFIVCCSGRRDKHSGRSESGPAWRWFGCQHFY